MTNIMEYQQAGEQIYIKLISSPRPSGNRGQPVRKSEKAP